MRKKIETVSNESGCLLCISHHKTKSGHVQIRRNGKTQLLHRLIYSEKHGEIPDGMVVRHKCDNPSCVNIEHLELGTHAQNVSDRVQRNRSAIGSNHGRSKLKESDVRCIRNDITSSNQKLAKKYCVDAKVIRDIRQFKTWKHVK